VYAVALSYPELVPSSHIWVGFQVHYNVIVEQPDNSGLVLHLSKGEGIQHFAGLWTFVAGFEIPARTPRHEVNIECCYRGTQPLHAFAFR
jgi:hypothetical protein